MTDPRSGRQPDVDTGQSEHEREVAERLEHGPGDPSSDATVDEGRRPTSGEDLAADRSPDPDAVGDDESGPGQTSDRMPQ